MFVEPEPESVVTAVVESLLVLIGSNCNRKANKVH